MSDQASSWHIPRQRLNLPKQMLKGRGQVVVICAPAGYGKSTQIAQWEHTLRKQDWQIVSLHARSDDHQGDRLVMDLAKNLGSSGARARMSLLDSTGQIGRGPLLRALLAELSAGNPRSALVIDDVHELLQKPAENVLRQILNAQPEGLTCIFSSRTPLAGLVSSALLEGRLHRLGISELAFSVEESAALLRQHGIVPRKSFLEELQTRTQGWPAAVRLVALSLDGDDAAQDQLLGALQGDSQLITDYLNDSVINRMPPRIYEHLLRLSLLPSFSTALAGAVAGCQQAQALLDELARRALPITRVGGQREEYKLHPLFRGWLLKRLQSGEHPFGDLLAPSYARAYKWLLDTGDVDKAIEVCLNAGYPDQAAQLIGDHAQRTAQQYGQHNTYLYWTNKLPADVLARHPEIRLHQAWSLNFLRRWEEADAIRANLQAHLAKEHKLGTSTNPAVQPRVIEAGIELQQCAKAGLSDQAMACVSSTQQWLSNWPKASAFDRAVAHVLLAFSMKSLSQFPAALEHIRTAQSLCRECQGHYVQSWACMLAVTILVKQGRYRQALDECDLALDELAPALGVESPAATMLHAMRAGLLYEFNRLGEARDALGHGLTALMEQSSTDPIIVGYVTLARLQFAAGDSLEALQTLAEGEAAGRVRGLPRVAICLGAERVNLLLRSEENDQASGQWEELQQLSSGPAVHEPWHRVLEDKANRIHARIALSRNNAPAAIELTDEALAHARASGQKRKQTEILLLRAMALYADESPHALDCLQDALDIALAEGYQRTLLDEGKRLQPLLTTYLRDKSESSTNGPGIEYAQRLLNALGNCGSSCQPASDSEDRQKQLTARERQILARMQTGPGNKQLADALFITEGTLKWHLTNIYAKLGVKNRVAAIAAAKDMNLLEGSE